MHQLLVSTDSLSHGDGRDQGGRSVRKEERNGEGAGGENSQESSCFSSRLWTRLPRAAGAQFLSLVRTSAGCFPISLRAFGFPGPAVSYHVGSAFHFPKRGC